MRNTQHAQHNSTHSTQTTTTMDNSVFTHALDLWSKADLPQLQKTLDTSVLEVKDLEQKSLDSRKALATETKKFKKLEQDQKMAHLNKLIKQYQKEIDNLTKRSKFSEDALLDLYANLSEAPDPKPLLEASLHTAGDKEELEGLRSKLATLQDQAAKHADYDKIKARLLDLEQRSAETLTKRLLAKEQELTSTWEEKQRNWADREADLVKQLETLKNNNKVLETKLSKQVDLSKDGGEHEHEHKHGYEYEHGSDGLQRTAAEYELLAQELDSCQLRAMDLEKRNEELSGALARANSDAERESLIHTKDLKINQLESENALLSASLERERVSVDSTNAAKDRQIQSMGNEIATYKGELETVRRKLNNHSDYDAIKQELVALKRIEFGADDEEGDADMESSLLSANKKLQSNLAELRGKTGDIEKANAALRQESAALKQQVAQLEQLNAKLELDLEKIEDVGSKFTDTQSVMSGATRQMNRVNTSAKLGGKLSPTSSIIGIPEESEVAILPPANSTILPIVTQQRDRFRSKNMDLEKQLKQSSLEHGRLKSELAKLTQDNKKLYERIRYLSSYSNNSSISNGNGGGGGGSGSGPSQDFDSEAQYSKSYDESLHPLADFKQRELERYQRSKMSPLERLFLSFAKIVLANKTSRMLFMFYCVGLHGLVIMMGMYVVSFNGYLTPEVGIVQTSVASQSSSAISDPQGAGV